MLGDLGGTEAQRLLLSLEVRTCLSMVFRRRFTDDGTQGLRQLLERHFLALATHHAQLHAPSRLRDDVAAGAQIERSGPEWEHLPRFTEADEDDCWHTSSPSRFPQRVSGSIYHHTIRQDGDQPRGRTPIGAKAGARIGDEQVNAAPSLPARCLRLRSSAGPPRAQVMEKLLSTLLGGGTCQAGARKSGARVRQDPCRVRENR